MVEVFLYFVVVMAIQYVVVSSILSAESCRRDYHNQVEMVIPEATVLIRPLLYLNVQVSKV